MSYPTYTIMDRRYYYAGTLGGIRGWQPIRDLDMAGDDAPDHRIDYWADLGQNIVITSSPAAAREIIECLDDMPYRQASGEYSRPSYGYVQPSGRIRRLS